MSVKFLTQVGSGLVMGFICLNAWSDNVMDYFRMHVQISNYTDSSCQLTGQYLSHGTLLSAPPQSLMVNDSKSFDAQQSILGPEVLLTYRCGSKSIQLDIDQSTVIFFGKAPSVTVTETNGLKVESVASSGSAIWGNAGMINIALLPI